MGTPDPKSNRDRLPTADEIGSCDPSDLDARSAVRNFHGKTLEEAEALLPSGGTRGNRSLLRQRMTRATGAERHGVYDHRPNPTPSNECPAVTVPREVLRLLATLRYLARKARRAVFRLNPASPRGVLDVVSGFDFFISYARSDASTYARDLREKLVSAGLRCFLDEHDFFPGDDLSEATAKNLRKCSALILVGSPGVAQSRFVPQELMAFGLLARPVIPINIAGALQGALPSAVADVLEGRLWINEAAEALATEPSSNAIGEILRRVDFTRQESRRVRIFAAASVLFAAVACAAVIFAMAAKRQARISRSGQLAAESQRLLATEPQRLKESITLALKSMEAWTTPEAVASLRQALRFTPRSRTVLKPPGAPNVVAAAVAPDGKIFAISARTGDTFDVRLLGPDGQLLAPVLPMPKWPEALAFDPSGETLAVGLRGAGGVQIWDWRAGRLKAHLPHPEIIHGLAWRNRHSPQLATACSDGKVRLWEISAPEQPMREWLLDDAAPDLPAPAFRVAFDASGDLLAASGGRSGKGRVRLRDLRSNVDISARDLDSTVTGLALTPDARILAASTLSGRLEVWRTRENDTVISRAAANGAVIDSVALRDDGRFVACAGWEKAACVWELATRQEVLRVPHSDKVWGLAFLPDKGPLLTASSDGAIGLWPVDSGSWERRWVMEKKSVSWVRFSPSEREWWCRSIFEGIRHGKVDDDAIERVPGIENSPTAFALAPDERTAVIGTVDGHVKLFDLVRGVSRLLPREPSDPHIRRDIRSVAFSADGARVAAASYDGRCDAWETASGASIFHSPKGQRYLAVAFSHDGSDVFYGGDDRQLRWRRLDGTAVKGTLPCPAPIERIVVNPSAPEVAVLAGKHVLIARWERDGWIEKDRIAMSTLVTALTWSADGGLLFIGTDDGRAALCNNSNLANATAALHTACITAAAFSRDGRMLATGSWDGTAALWRLPELTLLGRFEHPGEQSPLAAVQSVDLSADGTRLLTGSDNGRIYLWTIQAHSLLESARTRRELLFVP